MLRVSKDPLDKAFSETAARRRVWCQDQEVLNWITADEFRRVVITVEGKVLNGGVRIERLPEDAPPPVETPVEVPVSAGFVGAGLVHVPDTPVATPAPTPAPTPEQVPMHIPNPTAVWPFPRSRPEEGPAEVMETPQE